MHVRSIVVALFLSSYASAAFAQGIVPLILIMAQQKKQAQLQQQALAADRREIARQLDADRALRERELQLRAIELKLRAEAQAIGLERQRHLDGVGSDYPSRTYTSFPHSYSMAETDGDSPSEIDGVAFPAKTKAITDAGIVVERATETIETPAVRRPVQYTNAQRKRAQNRRRP